MLTIQVRDKIMEEMREPRDSDDEESGEEEESRGGEGGLDWDEANGSKHMPSWHNLHHVNNNNSNNRSNTSLTDSGLLKPAERAGMSWNDVVRDGYGWGIQQQRSLYRDNSFGYNSPKKASSPYLNSSALSSIIDRPQSRTGSRICLSFSDLSRIFPSVETMNQTRGSQQGIHDPENSSTSLPSLTDNFLSPMICYQRVGTLTVGLEGLDLHHEGEDDSVKLLSSRNSVRS